VINDGLIVRGDLVCSVCQRRYGIRDGIPVFIAGLDASGDLTKQDRIKHISNWKFGRIFQPFILRDKPEERRGLTLDLGCGDKPRGDVNVDVFVPQDVPENFVLADVENLPFKDKCFDIVRSSYVIEHCVEPVRFITAVCRIAKQEVRIITDNGEWFGIFLFRLFHTGFLFHDEHCYLWTDVYMRNLMRRLGLTSCVSVFNSSRNLLTIMFSLPGKIAFLSNWFCNSISVRIKCGS